MLPFCSYNLDCLETRPVKVQSHSKKPVFPKLLLVYNLHMIFTVVGGQEIKVSVFLGCGRHLMRTLKTMYEFVLQ